MFKLGALALERRKTNGPADAPRRLHNSGRQRSSLNMRWMDGWGVRVVWLNGQSSEQEEVEVEVSMTLTFA